MERHSNEVEDQIRSGALVEGARKALTGALEKLYEDSKLGHLGPPNPFPFPWPAPKPHPGPIRIPEDTKDSSLKFDDLFKSSDQEKAEEKARREMQRTNPKLTDENKKAAPSKAEIVDLPEDQKKK